MLRKLFAAVALAGFASVATAQETLVVHWTKGFYPQEDKALDDMVAKFEKKTGVKVELSRYSPQESVPKAVAALDSGTPPDVAYGDVFDFQVAGKWAAEGRLVLQYLRFLKFLEKMIFRDEVCILKRK